MFSDGLAHVTNRTNTKILQIDELARKQMEQKGTKMHDLVKDIDKQYNKQRAGLKKELNLLSPKRQIRRIFPTLFLALIFLTLYHISKNQCWFTDQNFFIRNLFFILSFISATIGVVFLKNVAWAVIDVKQELAANNNQGKEKVEKLSPIDKEK